MDELLEATGATDMAREAAALADVSVDAATMSESAPFRSESARATLKQTNGAGAIDLLLDATGGSSGALRREATIDVATVSTNIIDIAAETASLATPLPVATVLRPSEHAVVEFINSGGSVSAAAAKFSLSRTEVSRIVKDAAAALANAAIAAENSTTSSGDSNSETETVSDDDGEIERSGAQQQSGSGTRKRKVLEQPIDSVVSDVNAMTPVSSVVTTTSLSDAATALDAAGRAKRVRKSKEEKLEVLQFVEQGGTHGTAAEKFGISRTAVTKMVKEREVIWSKVAPADVAAALAPSPPIEVPVALPQTEPLHVQESAMQSSSPPPVAAAAQPLAVPLESVASPALIDEPLASTNALADVASPVLSTSVTTSMSIPPVATVVPTTPAMKKDRLARAPNTAPSSITTSTTTTTTAGATQHRKGKRVRKTNVEKLEILAFVEQGGSQGAAAEKFGVSRTAVTKMVKEKDAIAAQASLESSTHRKVLQYQHKLSVIEDMLYKWQVQLEFATPTAKVTGELLQSKAMEFRNKILVDFGADLPDDVVVSLTDFKASNGWLHRYTQRRNVRSLTKHAHDIADATTTDAANAERRVDRVRAQLALAPLACIWNVDEVALRHRTTSARADATVNIDARSHEKLTVTLAVSAAGETLRLQAIGARADPASLRDVDPALTLGVAYYAQRKACPDSATLAHVVTQLNHEARTRKQLWYVLLDSCPAHVAAARLLDPAGSFDAGFKVDAVVLLIVPPTSADASSAQPLQLGVARAFKTAFRYEMLQALLDEYAQWQQAKAAASAAAPVFDVHTVTHTRNALAWLHAAWSAVSATTIRQAWARSTYLPPHLLDELSADAARPVDSSSRAALVASVTAVAAKRELALALGFDANGSSNSSDVEQIATDLVALDDPEAASDRDANDDEIVLESLSAQGLIRESQRVTQGLLLDTSAAAAAATPATGAGTGVPDVASLSDACASVEKLLRFVDKSSHEPVLPATDRRAGRSNLLALHRILLKARAKERSSTAYTV